MKKFDLVRSYLHDRTLGYMDVEGYTIKTLERQWLNNKRDVSCIPEGTYVVKRDKHGRHQWWAVQNVPGRTAIEWHEGQLPTHSDGCILVGTDHDPYLNLKGSGVALEAIKRKVGDDTFQVTIRSFNPNFDQWPD